jgi:hypothetical protein
MSISAIRIFTCMNGKLANYPVSAMLDFVYLIAPNGEPGQTVATYTLK